MLVQSLGGMEIVVGMSSLAGGLVLDKSELVQGSELPINYLFGFTIAAHSDRVVRMGRLEWDVVLNHILSMGIYDKGMVKEQRRTSEDFKDQIGILVSKLLERDSNVGQSFETVEKWLNRHRFTLNKAEDQVRLQVLQRSAMSS